MASDEPNSITMQDSRTSEARAEDASRDQTQYLPGVTADTRTTFSAPFCFRAYLLLPPRNREVCPKGAAKVPSKPDFDLALASARAGRNRRETTIRTSQGVLVYLFFCDMLFIVRGRYVLRVSHEWHRKEGDGEKWRASAAMTFSPNAEGVASAFPPTARQALRFWLSEGQSAFVDALPAQSRQSGEVPSRSREHFVKVPGPKSLTK